MKGNRCGKEKLCLKQQFSLIKYFFWTSWCFCASFFFAVRFSSIWYYLDPGPLYLLIGGSILYSVLRVLGCRRVLASTSKSHFSIFVGPLGHPRTFSLAFFWRMRADLLQELWCVKTWIHDPQMWDPSYKFHSGSAREAYEKLMRSLWEMGGHISWDLDILHIFR